MFNLFVSITMYLILNLLMAMLALVEGIRMFFSGLSRLLFLFVLFVVVVGHIVLGHIVYTSSSTLFSSDVTHCLDYVDYGLKLCATLSGS